MFEFNEDKKVILTEQVQINKAKIEALEGDVSSLEQQIDGIDVPNQQSSLSIVQNALTNLNGWVLTRFSATLTTISGYDVYQIKLSGQDGILSEEDAIKYMEDMTGSKFLPRYDYFKPQNSFLVFADQTIWKPQYDDVNGLLLFKLPVNFEPPEIPTITIYGGQVISTSPFIVNPDSSEQEILEDLSQAIIKVDISYIYSYLGLDAPYAWVKRNAIKELGDSSNGAELYEFVCNNNDFDPATGNLTKLGNIAVYYFNSATGIYSGYSKKILISSGKITLSNLSHATNLLNGTGSGSLVQIPIQSTFSFSNAASGQTGTKDVGATAVDSTVLGGISRATGDSSLAAGKNNIAGGWASAAFGNNTYSNGDKTFTEGTETTATGGNAHAAGQGTVAAYGNQFVIGRWNSNKNGNLFEIGNGSSNSSRSNALEVSQEGYLKCVGVTDGNTQKTLTQLLSGGGGTQLYKHTLNDSGNAVLEIITDDQTPMSVENYIYWGIKGHILGATLWKYDSGEGGWYCYNVEISPTDSYQPFSSPYSYPYTLFYSVVKSGTTSSIYSPSTSLTDTVTAI